MILYSKQSPY